MVDARNLAFARDSYISAARDSFLFLSFFFFFLGWGGGLLGLELGRERV